MTKSIIVAIVTLSLGAIAGVVAAQNRLGGEMEQLRAEHRESLRLANEVQETLSSTERRADRLAQQNAQLEERLERLHATLNSARGDAGAGLGSGMNAQGGAESMDWDVFAGVDDVPMDMPGWEDGPRREAAMNWRAEMAREREEETEQEAAEREARREARREEWEERAQQMRENMRERLNEAIQTAGDPQSRDRMRAVSEYSELLMDLREQMRGADEEQREALMQEMRDVGGEVRRLVEEQQQHTLRNVVEQYAGIEDPAEQQAFIRQFQEAQSDNLFGGGRGGGIPGMGRGGPGGGRGR